MEILMVLALMDSLLSITAFSVLKPANFCGFILNGKADSQENYAKLPDQIFIRFESLPLSLILDGKVQDDSLEKLGKTRFWLKNQLQAKEVRHFKDVFFCSIDHRGKLFVDRKR